MKLTTPEAKRLLRHGCGREVEVSGNGLCQDLGISEALFLSDQTPLDLRRASGAWMLLNQHAALSGDMSVCSSIQTEKNMTVAEYARHRLDPNAEAHADDVSTGRRNFPQGTLIDLHCYGRRDTPTPPFPHPVPGEGGEARVVRQDVKAAQRGVVAAGGGGGRVQPDCDGCGRGGGGAGAGNGAHQRGGAAGGIALQRVPGGCAAREGAPMRLWAIARERGGTRGPRRKSPRTPLPFLPGLPGLPGGSQGRTCSG